MFHTDGDVYALSGYVQHVRDDCVTNVVASEYGGAGDASSGCGKDFLLVDVEVVDRIAKVFQLLRLRVRNHIHRCQGLTVGL